MPAIDRSLSGCRYLSIGGLPIIGAYALYTLVFDCHKGWYSYVLYSVATIVYALGFALMTPQLFINYKLKSVAFLPCKFNHKRPPLTRL